MYARKEAHDVLKPHCGHIGKALEMSRASRMMIVYRSMRSMHIMCHMPRFSLSAHHAYEGPATKSGLRNPPIENMFIGPSCGADQCGFNEPTKQDNCRLETKFSGMGCWCLEIFLRES